MIGKQMEKKKIVGLIIFFILIWLFVDPKIGEKAFELRVRGLINKGQYSTAYSMLERRELEPSSINYLLMMHCEFMLGEKEEFNAKLRNLISKEKRDFLQELVDTYGVQLGSNLVQIYNLRGVSLSQEQRAVVAIEYANRRNFDRAMEARGEKSSYDFVALKYDLNQGNIQRALDGYYDIPKELQSKYIDMLIETMLSSSFLETLLYPLRDWGYTGKVTDVDEYIEFISSLNFPEEIFRKYVSRLAQARHWHIYDHNNDKQLDIVFRNPLFTSNEYYSYYESLANPWRINVWDQVKINFVNNSQFVGIDTRDLLVEYISTTNEIGGGLQISKSGVLLYNESGGEQKRFDTKSNRFLKDLEDQYTILNASPDRSYFIAVSVYFNTEFYLLDDQFNIVKELTGTDLWGANTIFWLDNDSFVYRTETGQLAHNVSTGEESRWTSISRGKMIVDRYRTGTSIWSLGEETYSTLEVKYNYNFLLEEQVYRVREGDTGRLINEIDIKGDFLGSCDRYVYEVETVEYGFGVLVAIDKQTKERMNLPFYLQRGFNQDW